MFKFNKEIKSHMPFVTHSEAPNFEPKEFACIMINEKWKLHHFENGAWKRIFTWLPDDATECAPCAEFEPESGKWNLSFIAGGFENGREFYLYKIDDLDNPKPEKLSRADVGFVWKNTIVYAKRNGPINICDGEKTLSLKLTDVEYLYRISYNPNNPNELLISGQSKDGTLFSWICNPYAKTLREVFANDEVAYKMALFNGQCFYAKRNSDDAEDRSIIEAQTFSEEVLDYNFHISEILGVETPTTFQMAKNLASSAVRWAQSGFALADTETLENRKTICNACEHWESEANLGLGKCQKCGCTSVKLRLASETCPIDKWSSFDTEQKV